MIRKGQVRRLANGDIAEQIRSSNASSGLSADRYGQADLHPIVRPNWFMISDEGRGKRDAEGSTYGSPDGGSIAASGCQTSGGGRRARGGVSAATIYAWKAKYGGMTVSEAQEAKQLREENARLKKMLADVMLDKDMLQSGIRKNLWPAA
jgi:Transposase